MQSKVKEMAVFSIGLGLINVALVVYLAMMGAKRVGGDHDFSIRDLTLALIPGAIDVALGVWILASPGELPIRATAIIIGGMSLLAGFFPFSIPTLLFAVLVNAVLWPAHLKALAELKRGDAAPTSQAPRWMTDEENPFNNPTGAASD